MDLLSRLFRPKLEHLDHYLRRGQYRRAEAAVAAQLVRRPNDPELLRQLARVFEAAGRPQNALEVQRRLARAYVREGLHTRAIVLYKQLLSTAPDAVEIHAELAQLIELEGSTPDDLSEDDTRSHEIETSTLFTMFEPAALEELLTSTHLHRYQGGDVIVSEGEPGESLFLIVDGEVKVFIQGQDRKPIQLNRLGPGDLFGEVSVLLGKPRTATITACGDVSALEVIRTDVQRIASRHPRVLKVLKDFCDRRSQGAVETLIGRLQQPETL